MGNKQNYGRRKQEEKLEEMIKRKYAARDRKKRKKMKVSGAGVKGLARIIKNK